MRLVGLTGGIATGKSTVSAMLRLLGAHVLDADEIAREVVQPGQPALLEISRRFPGVLLPDGTLDRKKLGQRVFNDAAERAALNALIHPRIQEVFRARTHALSQQGVPIVVYDAPLLVENGVHAQMDDVIVVSVPREVQRQRLMARNGLSESEAEQRIASQLPLSEKEKVATYVVDNSGTVEETRKQVERVWTSLLAAA